MSRRFGLLALLSAVPMVSARAAIESTLEASVTPHVATVRVGEPVGFLVAITHRGPETTQTWSVETTWAGARVLRGFEASADGPSRLSFELPPFERGRTHDLHVYGVADTPGTIDFRATIRGGPGGATAEAEGRIVVTDGSPGLDPDYDQLGRREYEGLRALGRNPQGFWEFWMPAIGSKPIPGSYGEYVIEEDTAMVFVLVPAGTYTIGAQKDDRAAPHFDSMAQADEGPAHDVRLDPFFVSKYEMTQGQWQRVTGDNPSVDERQYGEYDEEEGRRPAIRPLENPVENVSFDDCARVLAVLGLTLPTEAQWEVAARARTTTPYWCGVKSDVDAKIHVEANRHSPVHHGPSNDFGLYHVLGNVWEWCRDGYGPYSTPAGAGDGLRIQDGATRCVLRGGGYATKIVKARSAFRNHESPGARFSNVGCRPVRRLDG